MSAINVSTIKADTIDWTNTQLASTFNYANTANTNTVTTLNNQDDMVYSIYVPAGALIPASRTAPEYNTRSWYNDVSFAYGTLDFDSSAYESAYYYFIPPKSWTGNVSMRFVWTHKPTTVNFGVQWDAKLFLMKNGSRINGEDGLNWSAGDWYPQGFTNVTDVGGDDRKMYVTDKSYISGTKYANNVTGWGPDREGIFLTQIYRSWEDGNDTLAVDAKLLGVWFYLTYDNFTDN